MFEAISPTLLQKVSLMGLEPYPGKRLANMFRRLDTISELTGLNSISSKELKLMNVCHMCTDSDQRQKICKLVYRSWESVKDTVRAYNTARDMDVRFSPNKGENCTKFLEDMDQE